MALRLLALALAFALFSHCGESPGRGGALADFRLDVEADSDKSFAEVGDFTLTRQDGTEVGLEDLRGRPWVAASFFTRCMGPCPRLSRSLKEVQKELEGTDVVIVSISVDPTHDTPEALTRYAEEYGADPERWWFLTGPEPEIYTLLRTGFSMAAQRTSDDVGNVDPGGHISHSSRLVAIDREGRVRGMYPFEDQRADLVARMRFLAEE